MGADARDPLTPEGTDRPSEIAELRARLAELEALEGPRRVDLGALYAPPPATIRWSPDAVVTHWSSEAARLFGWLREEAVGQDLVDLVVADDIPRDEARALFRSAARGHLSEARIAGRTRDGRRPQHRWAHSVSRDAEGNAVEVVSEIEDAGEVVAEDVLHHARYIFLAVVNHVPSLIYVKDLRGRYVVVNQRVAEALGLSADALLGRTDEELFPAKTAARIRAQDERALHGDGPLRYEGTVTTPEGQKTYLSIKFPLRHPSGALLGLCCISDDVTAERLAEEERSGLQEQIIEAHRTALRELSTPLVPIAKGVLAVPLVGNLDGARGKTLMEALLEGVKRHQARAVLLDVTGVREVGQEAADALVRAARAAGLLGAEVTLTGVSPGVAQALVRLGVDLDALVMAATLEHGVRRALSGTSAGRRGGA
ncbi:MAG TPA: PAS domain-containing protein [Polyangiaceae bacterium]|nr:PAS domain-containing protein [Polyangiaceae bacterium]